MKTTVRVPREIGQNGARTVTAAEAETTRRITVLECEGAAMRAEIDRLKRTVAQLAALVTSTARGGER